MKPQLRYYLFAQPGLAVIYHATMWLSPYKPVTLPLTVFDHLIPYNDWFAAIYLSFFVLLFYTVSFSAVPESFACTIAVLFAAITAGVLFICFPTVYRETNVSSKPSFLLQIIKSYDRNYNCFPSLHVAVSFICCYYASVQKSFTTKYFFTAWFLLLLVSVLVTQQHYFYDAVGGLVLEMAVLAVDGKWWCKQFFKS